jgi:hypothetical protein
MRFWVAVLDSLDAIAASRHERDPRSSHKQFPDKRQSQAGCPTGNSRSQATKLVSMMIGWVLKHFLLGPWSQSQPTS